MKSIFKKATVMALTLAVGMSLVAGCGNDKKDNKAAETTSRRQNICFRFQLLCCNF